MAISVAAKFNPSSVQQTILPGQTCAFDLGSLSLQFRNAFLNGYLSLLGSEVGGLERRFQEKIGDVQLVDGTSTLLRSLNTDVVPTTLTPTSVATIGTSTSYARGDHIHGINTSVFDGRYIKRSPSGENQTILPLTDNVPLTLQGPVGGLSDLLDVLTSSSINAFKLSNTGNATFGSGNVSIAPPSNPGVLLVITPSGGQTLDLLTISSNAAVLAVEVLASGSTKLKANTGNVPLTVTGGTGADIFDLISSTSAFVFTVGVSGAVTILPSANVVSLTVQAFSGSTVDTLDIKDTGGTIGALFGTNANLTVKPALSGGMLAALVVQPTASVQPVKIQGAAAYTGGLLQVLDGTVVNQFNVTGVGTGGFVQCFNGLSVGPSSLTGLSPPVMMILSPATGASPAGQYVLQQWDGSTFQLNAAPGNFMYLNVTLPLSAAGGFNPNVITGLAFQPTITLSGQTWTKIIAVQSAPIVSGSGTVSEQNMFQGNYPEAAAGQTITLTRGLYLTPQGATVGTMTTIVAIDIDALPTATTQIAIRQSGTAETNRLAGNTRIGDTGTAPLQLLELRGAIPSLVWDGSEVSGVRLRMRENAGNFEWTNDTPTVILKLTGQGAVTINPLSNVIPLTVQGFSGGSADLFDINDGSGALQVAVQSTGRVNLKNLTGIGIIPSTGNLLQLGIPTGVSPGGSFNVIRLIPTYKLNASATTFNYLTIGSTLSATLAGGLTSMIANGLLFTPSVDLSGDTWSTIRGGFFGPGFTGSSGTVGEVDAVQAGFNTAPVAGSTVTLFRHFYSSAFGGIGAGIITTAIGVDIEGLETATTTIGIRQQGTGDVNQLAGKTRIGDTGIGPTRTFEINGSLAVKLVTQTANYTALVTDHYILGDATAAAITITLPASSASFANSVTQRLSIKKKDASVNTVTIAAAGVDTIQGAATVVLSAQYAERTLYTDGSGTWYVESTI